MFFLVFVLFLDCFFYMHLCAKLQPYSTKTLMIIRGQLHDNSCKKKCFEQLCALCALCVENLFREN